MWISILISISKNRWIQCKRSMNFNSDYNSKYNRNQFEIQFWFPFPRQHYFTDALCYYPMMPNRCNHKVTCFDAIRTGIFEQIIGFDDTPKTDCKMTWNGCFTTMSRSSWVMTATNISIEINDNWFFHSSRRNQHCQSSLSMHHYLRSPFGLLLPDQPCFLCLFWWQIEDLWMHPHTIWRIHRKSSVLHPPMESRPCLLILRQAALEVIQAWWPVHWRRVPWHHDVCWASLLARWWWWCDLFV